MADSRETMAIGRKITSDVVVRTESRMSGRRVRAVLVWIALALPCLVTVPAAQSPRAPVNRTASARSQPADDPDFARSVNEWTTRPEFSSPLVDHLPIVAGIPSPREVLGHHIGAPKQLTYYADILKYYRALASATPRVKVVPIGTSTEGRDLVVVFVGAAESIKNLETYRRSLAQLADPRHITDAAAKEIVARAKPIYHLMAGLHSGEVGPPEMLMELTYRLAVENSPLINTIRENVIVSITPVADPDGRDRNVDWYYQNGIHDTDDRRTAADVPYWGKYIHHDDNRDINYSQLEMRALLDWYLQWHPPIMHDLHQSRTLLYTFSGQAPQNPNLDPILYGELPMMANFEMAQMAKYGMPGVWTHGYVDMWSPGYLAFMASNHNGMIRMYEIQGTSGANTTRVRLRNPPSPASGRGAAPDPPPDATELLGGRSNQDRRDWFRPWPATGEFDWSLRNNTNYGETGVLTALQYTAAFPQVILENFYQKSRNAVTAGRTDPIAGYVIPAGQRDMTRVARVVNLLRTQGIEVGTAATVVTVKEGTFPAGSYVVKRDQPYGRLAKTLLEKQVYPDAVTRTYDDASWTMGLMSHVEVREIADKAVLDLAVSPVGQVSPAGTITGQGSTLAIAHYGSNHMATLRFRLKGLKVRAVEKEFVEGGVTFPAGSFVVNVDAATVRPAVEALGLTAVAMTAEPAVPMHDLDLPRVAVYSTWGSTQEVGWVRFTFDQFELPHELIYKERVRQGHLEDAYDVIVMPSLAGASQTAPSKRFVFDIASRGAAIPYKKSDRFKSLGMYGESDDITGGMGIEGVAALDTFVKSGGVLVTLGNTSFFPADFGLVPNIDAARPSPQFYAPGTIIDAEILQPEHPLFYGYDTRTIPVRYGNGPLLSVQTGETPPPDGPPAMPESVLLRYPGGDDHVLSGLMRGASEIRNRAAIIDQPSGKGRVILFAGNPCYRWQNFGEFNMLFNVVLNYNDIKPRAAAPAREVSR